MRSVRSSEELVNLRGLTVHSASTFSRSLHTKAVVHWLQPEDVPVPKNPIVGSLASASRQMKRPPAGVPRRPQQLGKFSQPIETK
jgi:hypothetical protein